MNNNSLITSFFNSPRTSITASFQCPLVTSPILLTQDSFESLEALSIQDHSPPGKRTTASSQLDADRGDPEDSVILLPGDQSLEDTERDQSILLVENATENCESLEIDANEHCEHSKRQLQTTLSGIFTGPPSSKSEVGGAEPGSRERRKAAIKASIQMTDILSPSRSKPPPKTEPTGARSHKKGVASIFLCTSEKKKLKEQKQEEERKKELEEKRNREIENEKYEAFYKFATEPLVNSRTVPAPSSQQGPSPPDETHLWTPLQHVRQISAPPRAPMRPLPFLDNSPVSVDSALEMGGVSCDFLSITSEGDDPFSSLSQLIQVDISRRERDGRVSELVEMFPGLPVMELYSHYRSLTCSHSEEDEVVSSADSKKRTRQRDTDATLSFRSKRRRNQSSSTSPDDLCVTGCLIVDSVSQSIPSPQEAVLWTEKYLPHCTSLLLSDSSAVSAMKTFLKNWKERVSERAVESGSESCNGTPRQAQSSEDDDFEVFLNRQRVFDEDTSDSSQWSANTSLAGTMLVLGGVAAGKTAAVYVLAREMGLKVLEINTIMNRSSRDLQLILYEATQSFRVSGSKRKKNLKHSTNTNNSKKKCSEKRAVDGYRKCMPLGLKPKDINREVEGGKSEMTLTDNSVILLDEVDIMFESDRGFWSAFQQIARETKLPIFLTANETNDFDILPDIFTNYILFPPNSLSMTSLFIRIILLVHDLDIPHQLALEMASYYWPDLRQLTLLLQFWLTPRLRRNNTKRKKKKRKEDFMNFLGSFNFSNTGFLFNIHLLLKTYIPARLSGCEGPSKQSDLRTYKYLRRQCIARDTLSILELCKNQVFSNFPRSPFSSARFGDGFSPDSSPDESSLFDQFLCEDIMSAASDCVTQQIDSKTFSDVLNKSFWDSILSQELQIDKKKEWKSSLFKIADSILDERGQFSTRNFGEDYLPYLKVICASESYRQTNSRRFKHYFIDFLTPAQIDLLTNAELAHFH